MIAVRLTLLTSCLISMNFALAAAPEAPREQRCTFPENYSNDGPWSMNGYSNWVETAINNIDTNGADPLKRYADEWNDPSCVLIDGRPRLSGMLKGFSNAIYYSGKNWDKSLDHINKLKIKLSNSPISAIAEAQYWFDYAWDARGSGYSSTVTQEGMKLFKERLRRAEKVLDDSKAYASSMPVWYEQMLIIKSSQGAPQRERDSILKEGVNRYSWYVPNAVKLSDAW